MEYHEKQYSSCERAVGKDEPLMIAWTAYKKTAHYANLLVWAGKHCEGELWGAFSQGFLAAQADKPTQ